MQSDILRLGVQHRDATRRHLRQHVHRWSRRNPRLLSLDGPDGLEADGSQVDRVFVAHYLSNLQLPLHSDADIRSAH